MLGIGCEQTSSPTASSTGSPCSFQASTAQPSRRHCIWPGTCGNSRLPPMKAPAKSVPPEMLHHQMSGVPILANCSDPHACASSLNGEPVVPSARTCRKPSIFDKSMPAFRQLAKKAAPAPKKVAPTAAAKRHKVVQSGAILLPAASTVLPPGLPSNRQQVVPLSSPLICAFHITQPVELYQ